MATYVEQLSAEPDRLRRILAGLIDEQETLVRRLEQSHVDYSERLDRHVTRLMLYRAHFGETHGETMAAAVVAEDASKLVTEGRALLKRQREILELFRSSLQEMESTGSLKATEQASALPEVIPAEG